MTENYQLELNLWPVHSDDNVIRIANTNPNPPIDWQDVKFLRSILEWALERKTEGIAMMVMMRDGDIMTGYTPGCGDNIFKALGGISYLEKRINDRIEDMYDS